MDDLQALTVEQLLTKLRADAARDRNAEAEARTRAERSEAAIRALEELQKPLLPATAVKAVAIQSASGDNGSEPEGPRGIAAVRAVVKEQPERIWKARDIHKILEARNWISPEAKFPLRGTEAAINRLWRRGELEKVATGRYRLANERGGVSKED